MVRIALLLAAALAGVAVAAGSSARDAPAPEGRIAFYSAREQAYVAVSPDGSPRVRLTRRLPSPVALSRDGRRIAFERGGALWVANADGSRAVRLADTANEDESPAWSADGRRLAFVSTGQRGQGGIFVVGADGSGLTSLCRGFCRLLSYWNLAWSPDGSRLAFVAATLGSAGHPPDIYVMDVATSKLTPVTRTRASESAPSWSPDGSQLAFAADGDLYVSTLDGSPPRALTSGFSVDDAPAWSPDGTRIAFAREGDVYVMDSDGSGVTRLTPGNAPIWLSR